MLGAIAISLLAACSPRTSTSSSSPSNSEDSTPSAESSSTPSESTSTSTPPVFTEALTEAMFAPFKEGYAAELYTQVQYAGDELETDGFLKVAAIDDIYWYDGYYINDAGDPEPSNDALHQIESHQLDGDTVPMAYDVSVLVSNEVTYVPLMGEDPYSFVEVPLTWADSHYGNAFALLEVSDFTRVGDSNEWALNMTDKSLQNAYRGLAAQLFDDDARSDLGSFSLLTNGDEITGFKMAFDTYSSAGTATDRSAYGVFTDSGADVLSPVTPIEGTAISEFDAAMKKLQNNNYEFKIYQETFDFNSEQYRPSARFTGKADGESYTYMQYELEDATYTREAFAYGYYNLQTTDEEGKPVTYLQPVVPINGVYYDDAVTYTGATVKDMLASFALNSVFFTKTGTAEDGASIYTIRDDVYVSRENNILVFTPLDSDSYPDLIINLDVTIGEDYVNFHNETYDERGVSGGILYDITYSNIGKVGDIMTETNTKDDATGLTWSEILTHQDATLEACIEYFGEEVLNSIPTFGGLYAYAGADVHSTPMFLTMCYDREALDDLLASYSAALKSAGFAEDPGQSVSSPMKEGEVWSFSKKDVTMPNGNKYKLSLKLQFVETYSGEYQFQVGTSLGKNE